MIKRTDFTLAGTGSVQKHLSHTSRLLAIDVELADDSKTVDLTLTDADGQVALNLNDLGDSRRFYPSMLAQAAAGTDVAGTAAVVLLAKGDLVAAAAGPSDAAVYPVTMTVWTEH